MLQPGVPILCKMWLYYYVILCLNRLISYDIVIEYYRVDIWGFFKRPELEMVKYMYIMITIMNDVLWKGRKGVFALSSILI